MTMTVAYAFATFDTEGLPTGFWQTAAYPQPEDGADRPAIVPSGATPLLKSQYDAFTQNPGARRWVNGHVVPYTPPGPTPEQPRKIDFPNLEPDQFWFVVRASGYETDLLDWVGSMNNLGSPNYNPVSWAAASAKLEFAKFFERDHPFVEEARQAIGMSEAELDALWSYATQ